MLDFICRPQPAQEAEREAAKVSEEKMEREARKWQGGGGGDLEIPS